VDDLKKNEFQASKIIDGVQKRLGLPNRTALARYIGISPSTLLRQEENGDVPYRKFIKLAKDNNWSLDCIFFTSKEVISNKNIKDEADLKIQVQLMNKHLAQAIHLSENVLLEHKDLLIVFEHQQLTELRVELTQAMIELALCADINEASLVIFCKSFLRFKLGISA
jgi:hypothetical protein